MYVFACQPGSLAQDQPCHSSRPLRRGFLLWALGLLWLPQLWAQPAFQDTTATFFLGSPVAVMNGSVAWGDFDAQGHFDLLVTGSTGSASNPIQTRLYRFNSTANRWQDFSGALSVVDVWQSDAEFGDYNNDGFSDILICGESSAGPRECKVYFYNSGNGTYQEDLTASPTLLGVSNATVGWGDYDNDGDLDIAIGGRSSTGLTMRIYRNDGSSLFQPDTILTGIENGALAWGDYDADGDLDLVYTGAGSGTGSPPILRLYKNNGLGNFSSLNTGIPALKNADLAWGDYDNDGDLDLLMVGEDASGTLVSEVYIYLGNDAFTPLGAGLTGVRSGFARWIDYDSDGWLDILIGGQDGGSQANDRTTELYRNDQAGGFVLDAVSSAALLDVNNGAAAAFGDVDGDDRPELALIGTSAGTNTQTIRVYKNKSGGPNLAPPVPTGLSATQFGTAVSLTWSLPVNYPATLANGLSYQLYLGTSPGSQNVVAAQSSLTTGQRRVARPGPLRTQGWRIFGLDPGTYYWSVQSIEGDLEASAFATEGSFTVVPTTSTTSVFVDATGPSFVGGISPQGLQDAAMAWGDIDNDGDLDLLLSGLVAISGPGILDIRTELYVNTPAGFDRYQNVFGTDPFPDVFRGDAIFADIDNDNDLDLIICGLLSNNSRVTRVLTNNGSGAYAAQGNLGLPSVVDAAIDLADFDQDGDLDVVISGNGSGGVGTITELYRNNLFPSQSLTFTKDANASNDLENVFSGDLAFGDYNLDGWPDLLLTGKNASGSLVGRLYRNDKTGRFDITPFVVPQVWLSSVTWADINNDGFLDWAVIGEANPSPSPASDSIPITEIRWQIPAFPDTFYSIFPNTLPGIANGTVAFGDYDDDGYQDLLLVGQASGQQRISELYKNNGVLFGPNFIRDNGSSATLTGVNDGSAAAWADFNGDGKLDVILTGVTAGGGKITKFYRNQDTHPNRLPNPPQNLSTSLENFDVRLRWDAPVAPAGYDPLALDGLNYTLYLDRIGSTADTFLRSPAANLTTGYRRSRGLGNVYQNREVLIRNLPPGDYVWTVQAVDQDFEGSTFAVSDTFTYEDPTFVDNSGTLFTFANLLPVREAALAWGDFDSDGDLDLAVSGASNTGPLTRLYVYDAVQNRFSNSGSSSILTDLQGGSIDWGDATNDNRVELLLSGENASGNPVTVAFRNIGGTFSGATGNFLTFPEGVKDGCARWVDYDNDGWRDVLITGEGSGGPLTKFYRNAGTGTLSFADAGSLGLPQLRRSWADWGDANLDGYPDLLIAGESLSGAETGLYLNDQAGGFTLLPVPGLPGLRNAKVAWGDYNADGWLDFVVTGENPLTNTGVLQVYRNDGDSTFTAQTLTGLWAGDVRWGDYNDDGYLDLLAAGQAGPGNGDRLTLLYRYDSGSQALVAEDLASAPFAALGAGAAVAWGDFDANGKLDLALAGDIATLPATGTVSVYRNINPTSNLSPGAPTGLSASLDGYEVVLRWNAPTNVPSAIRRGLSYNVSLGTTTAAINRRGPDARTSDGRRFVVGGGTARDTTAWRYRPAAAGTYFWRVQAIDADFEGGAFASGGSFTYNPPSFLNVTAEAFGGEVPEGLDEAAAAWADYDGDGDLDLLVAGQSGTGPQTQLWRNQGDSTFVLVAAGLTGLRQAALAWGDYDRDGDPDLVISGLDAGGTALTRLYRNDNGAFVAQGLSLPALAQGSLAWADYDNDGDEDLLLTGDQNGTAVTALYRNEGGNLVDAGIGLPGIRDGQGSWTDYNRDGFLDILLAGTGSSGTLLNLYRNDGAGGFSVVNNPGILPASEARTDWADYDRDGFPDLLVLGQGAVRVYRNNAGTGTFTSVFTAFAGSGVLGGSARWGDFDDNNRPDIAFAGRLGGGARGVRIYRNQSGGPGQTQFVLDSIAALPLLAQDAGTLAWGDYDRDGKLDLFMSGRRTSGPVSRGFRLLQNVDPTANLVPDAPFNLAVAQRADTIALRWRRPANGTGYSYNLYVSSAGGTGDIVSPLASLADGFRQVVRLGNTVQDTAWNLLNLPDGTYTWGVQAIGPDYEGSAFATGPGFTYERPDFVQVNGLNLNSSVPVGVRYASLGWADTDLDGDLDLLVMGETGTGTARTTVLENQGGVLTYNPDWDSDLENLRFGTGAWADFDLDGDPDLLLAGETPAAGGAGAGSARIRLYRNDGNGRFTLDARGDSLPALTLAAVAWADYDQDGDPDLVLTGRRNGSPYSALFLNEGSGFRLDTRTVLPAVEDGSVDWADFDQDGDLDLVISGRGSAGRLTAIYRNRGFRGDFEPLSSPALPGLGESSVRWGDYNRDGFPDLLISGETQDGSPAPRTALYVYAPGSGLFVEETGLNLPGLKSGQAAWGDYDDDGFADLVLTGRLANGSRTTRLYRNLGGTGLEARVVTDAALTGGDASADLAWGDFDGDGKLDLALTGAGTGAVPFLHLYRNLDSTLNVSPPVPVAAGAVASADSVVLSWTLPAPADGLTYNLWVSQDPNQVGVKSPLALATGQRLIAWTGNAGTRPAYRLTGLPAGTYYWRVQTVGADLEGSAFSAPDSFTFVRPHFIDHTAVVFDSLFPGGLDLSALAWGDYNGDGHLDLAAAGENQAGEPAIFLFRSRDGLRLEPDEVAAANLDGLRQASLAWGDPDRDGRLALAVVGESTTGPQARVYYPDGNTFSPVDVGLPALQAGKIAWVDADNNGSPDLFLSGTGADGNPRTGLYLNQGDRNFVAASFAFRQVEEGDFAWADLDRDRRPDLVLGGWDSNGQPALLVYLNDRNGNFRQVSNPLPAGVTPPGRLRLALGDADRDGYPDLIWSGGGNTPATQLFRNRADSTGRFEVWADPGDLPDTGAGPLSWGDYNEDGLADLLIAGLDGSGQAQAGIYRNQGGQTFVFDSLASRDLPAFAGGMGVWGDYNGDGKLDLALSGQATGSPLLRLYRNDEPTPNVPAQAPVSLREEVSGSNMILHWEAPAAYDSVAALGLSYNVFVGTAPAQGDVVSPLALLDPAAAGFRQVATVGPVGSRPSYVIEDLEEGLRYYWGVQVVEADLEGSPFAVRDFLFTPPAFEDVTSDIFPGGRPQSVTESAIAIADYDNDGDLDLVLAGQVSLTNQVTQFFRRGPAGYVADTAATALVPGLAQGDLAWGDYDNDGDLDLAVAGRTLDGNFVSQIYRNEGGTLSLDTQAGAVLVGVARAALAWGDADNDGDLDLVITGALSNGTPATRFYRNLGGGRLTLDAAISDVLEDVSRGDVAWGDYDSDGDLDLALTGQGPAGGVTHIYRNTGRGFVRHTELAQLRESSLAWGDFDNLGYLSLVVCGENVETNTPFARLYRNNPSGNLFRFQADTSLDLIPVYQGDLAVADYDDNGYLDILLSGKTSLTGNTRETKAYRTLAAGNIVEDLRTSEELVGLDLGALAFGDYDNDRKLDFFMTGRADSSRLAFAVFRNIDPTPNVTPGAPQALQTVIDGPEVTFRWQPPAGYGPELVFGLTYNLYLGTASNPSAVQDPAAQVGGANDGYRRLVYQGNAGQGQNWTFSGLADGDYEWSVQVVDPDYEGSAFAPVERFSYVNPFPVIADSLFASQYDDSETEAATWIELASDSLLRDVRVFYKGIASADWDSVTLSAQGLRYAFPITEALVDEMGLEYYYEARSIFPGFVTRTDTQYCWRYYADGLLVAGLRFGKDVTDYNIISIPLNLDAPTIASTIEDDFGTYNVFQWRIWRFDAGVSTEYGSGLDRFNPGEGYWLITKEMRAFNTGPGQVVPARDGAPWEIALKAGWNQIGNPYPYGIVWSDVMDAAQNPGAADVLDSLVLFRDEGYIPGDGIEAHRGAMIFADQPYTLRIPVRKNPSVRRVPRDGVATVAIGPLDSEQWQIPLVLESGGLRYPFGGVGMHPDAAEGRDPYDAITLPRLPQYLDINFAHPEYFAPSFSRDIVPSADAHIWDFTIEHNLPGEAVRLSWDNSRFGSGARKLILFDVERQLPVDMAEVDHYLSQSAEGVRHFRIYYGTETWLATVLQPERIHLGLAYPNPAPGAVCLPFSLPPAAQGYTVRLRVLTPDGREVAQPLSQEMPGGFHHWWWDREGQPAGLYLYQLDVQQGGDSYRQTQRLILR